MYLYHRVPDNMDGTILYPLNELRLIKPELYEAHAKKYRKREALMDRRIPHLNCLWNDVLFFTAVHPSVFRKAFERFCWRLPPFRCFRFSPTGLNPTLMTVLTRMSGPRGGFEEYEPFDPHNLEKHATIPQETFDYWNDEISSGSRSVFLWLHIPHILHRGPLDTRLATIEESTA